MKINLASVFVDDQDKALSFYTQTLGFVNKTEMPVGEFKWLTVVSTEDPDGVELVLEPSDHSEVKPFKNAIVADGLAELRNYWLRRGASSAECPS